MSDPRYLYWTSGVRPPVAPPPADLAPARPCDPADPQPHGAKLHRGIPDFPYAIRNSEFGIPESGIGKFGIMVRSSRPKQAILF